MPTTARQWLLNGHPRGRGIEDSDFKFAEVQLPDPGPGEMLFKTRYLGFDPAQKGWMENIADYVAPMAIGEVMRGSGIAGIRPSPSWIRYSLQLIEPASVVPTGNLPPLLATTSTMPEPRITSPMAIGAT